MELTLALESNDAGLGSLKPKQEETIKKFLSVKDTFVALLTGSSLLFTYAILASVYDKLRGVVLHIL